ncbi:proline-rich protein 36-like [Oreochromis niloticus]|uniref:proline-rich protein 36-like n=1 Tax=Oreochromis niloticus TaxID=8128 RepID=UPI000DF468C9|nr:proline-rich protein 36-like [Oreochromis niloticus]
MTEERDPDMDPAAHNPSAELREDLIYTVEYHCQEWVALPGEEYRETVAIRLQRMVSGLPWLFGALHPHIQDFLISTVRIRPELPLQYEELEDVQPGPLEDLRPGSSPPPSRRKRRSRCWRSRAAEQLSSFGESDRVSHILLEHSAPRLSDVAPSVSKTVLPSADFDKPESVDWDSADLKRQGSKAVNSVASVSVPVVPLSKSSVNERASDTSVLPKPGNIETISHAATHSDCLTCSPALSPEIYDSDRMGSVKCCVPRSDHLNSVHQASRSVSTKNVQEAPHETTFCVLSYGTATQTWECAVPQLVNVNGDRVPPAIVKLAKRFGLSASELLNQVEFCVPQSFICKPAHHACVPVPVNTEFTPQKTVVEIVTPLDYAAHQPVHSELVCEDAPASVITHSEPRVTDPEFAKPESVPIMTVLKAATYDMDNLYTAELLESAHHKSRLAETMFGTINLVHPVTVTAPMLRSPPPVPIPRAARAQLSLAPVSVPRVRVAEVQLVPAPVSSLAEAPFIPAPVPAPRVGLMDTQPSPVPVPVPRVRSAVTLPTPAPVSVPRVGAAEVQLVPAPTPAPRVKAARAQFVPAPVSVPRVGMAGVRPGPAPVPAPRRRAAKSQTPAESPAQLPADPPSLQPPLQLALLSIAQSLAQLLAQFPVLSPAQSLAQLSAPLPVQSFALLPPQFLAPSPVQLSAQSLTLSPAQLVALQPVQLLPPSARSSCESTQPAEDCVVLTKLGQTVCTAQPQPLHPKPTACPVQLQLASTEPEVSAPAGSPPLLAGGSGEPLQPSLVSAGGSGQPSQHLLVSAEGSGGPLQPLLVSVGGSGQPGQHLLVSAGGSGEPLQPLLVSTGGSGQPGQHLLVSAGGSGEPLQPLFVSAGGAGEPLQPLLVSAGGSNSPSPGPASASASAPPTPSSGPASASAPPGPAPASASAPPTPSSGPASASPSPGQASASASPSPGPASASASSSPGPASASPTPAPASASAPPTPSPGPTKPPSGPTSSGPVPTKPRPARPMLESRRLPRGRPPDPLCSRRRLPRGRPRDPLCSRRRLPRGRPPDPLCSRCHFSRGRPPEQPDYELSCCRPSGRPSVPYGRCFPGLQNLLF